jgi:hypothetical protein
LDQAAIKTNKFTAWIRHTHSLEQAHHCPALHLVNCLPFFSFSSLHLILCLSRLGRTLLGDSCLARKFDCILILSGCCLDVGAHSSRHTSPGGQDLHIRQAYITRRPGFVHTPPGIHHKTARSLPTNHLELSSSADMCAGIHVVITCCACFLVL